ncbi:nuclear pore complex protein Nup50 [Phascolarctos cinereus]|uniref:Nuclear pore complex protein Nup50 n=1 Tax=Phascolarctos cinereus TaxID=38626 RepID=A0A6P5JFS2_PHACI|nr:nuclear pore complex protein Nup50 [Phascolarctos cinereus]XP_020833133.1 nuclear pore complex protein Nup50 [Phascolarctos cinereus]
MAKRNAEKELTDRNWDQEDEVEEVGTFSVASKEVLKNRAIKKAKRRSATLESESGGAFKGFKGFVVPPGGGGLFGNGTSIRPLEGLSNGGSMSSVPTSTPTKAAAEKKVTFGRVTANGPMRPAGTDKKAASTKTNGDSQQPSSSGHSPSAYHRQLAALNCSVRDWIAKHVDSNPLCDLTPIFKDYERYLLSIEQLAGSGGSSDSGVEREAGRQQPRDAPFVFDADKANARAEAPAEKKVAPAVGVASVASFHFGQKVNSSFLGPLGTGPTANFSFSPGSAGIFGKDVAQASSGSSFSKMPESQPDASAAESKGAEEDESEEPPKAIVTEVKEEDAFYSKKCKLFYKKDNEFKEKGVGTLHLKPAANQKTQLLVRADTNLGNILLNVLVPPNMPCSRTGKNNVLIVCIPNPPISEKNATIPVTMLIRVKTTEDADELHKILLEKKEA